MISTMQAGTPRVLAKGIGDDKAVLIATLLSLGLWDALEVADRQAWCERAEVLDTPGGRMLFRSLQAIGIFDEAKP